MKFECAWCVVNIDTILLSIQLGIAGFIVLYRMNIILITTIEKLLSTIKNYELA